jgi:hypothetical protein
MGVIANKVKQSLGYSKQIASCLAMTDNFKINMSYYLRLSELNY